MQSGEYMNKLDLKHAPLEHGVFCFAGKHLLHDITIANLYNPLAISQVTALHNLQSSLLQITIDLTGNSQFIDKLAIN